MSAPHSNKGRPLRRSDLWSRQRPNPSLPTHTSSCNPLVSPSSSHSVVDSLTQQFSCSPRSLATMPSIRCPNSGSNNIPTSCSFIASLVDSSNKFTSPPRSEEGSVSSFSPPYFSLMTPTTNLATHTARAQRADTRTPTSSSPPPNHSSLGDTTHIILTRSTPAYATGVGGLPPEGGPAPIDEGHADPLPGGSDRPHQERVTTMRANSTVPTPSAPSPPLGGGPVSSDNTTSHSAIHRRLPESGICPLLSPPDLPPPPGASAGASSHTGRKRPLTLHDFWCPDRPSKTRTRRPPICHCPAEELNPGRRRPREQPEGDRPSNTPVTIYSEPRPQQRFPPPPPLPIPGLRAPNSLSPSGYSRGDLSH